MNHKILGAAHVVVEDKNWLGISSKEVEAVAIFAMQDEQGVWRADAMTQGALETRLKSNSLDPELRPVYEDALANIDRYGEALDGDFSGLPAVRGVSQFYEIHNFVIMDSSTGCAGKTLADTEFSQGNIEALRSYTEGYESDGQVYTSDDYLAKNGIPLNAGEGRCDVSEPEFEPDSEGLTLIAGLSPSVPPGP